MNLAGELPDKQGLALFDFDGTITSRDSFLYFLFFSQPFWRFCFCSLILSPVVLGYWLRLLNNNTAKQLVLRVVFGGCSPEEFRSTAQSFAEERLPALVRPEAAERIEWHRHLGHRIIVVSASLEDYLRPWCEKQQLELIGSRMAVADGVMTGRLEGRNCYGPEKVRRIREVVELSNYDITFAYGDSRGDREMLELADTRCYRRF